MVSDMSDQSAVSRLVAKITGYVQGVGYRFFAEVEANRLGLTGYARNMPDGSVEVVAEGRRDDLNDFLTRLRKGSPGARVTDAQFSFVPATGEFRDFGIRRWT